MRVLKLAVLAILFTLILFLGRTSDHSWAQAQASTPISGTDPAREIATSHEDITLTNSCIESGQEKIYCLCVTKIFKHKMTLRQYRGAIAIYNEDEDIKAQNQLRPQGYSPNEAGLIKALSKDLSSEDKFRARCDKAETYFAIANES